MEGMMGAESRRGPCEKGGPRWEDGWGASGRGQGTGTRDKAHRLVPFSLPSAAWAPRPSENSVSPLGPSSKSSPIGGLRPLPGARGFLASPVPQHIFHRTHLNFGGAPRGHSGVCGSQWPEGEDVAAPQSLPCLLAEAWVSLQAVGRSGWPTKRWAMGSVAAKHRPIPEQGGAAGVS